MLSTRPFQRGGGDDCGLHSPTVPCSLGRCACSLMCQAVAPRAPLTWATCTAPSGSAGTTDTFAFSCLAAHHQTCASRPTTLRHLIVPPTASQQGQDNCRPGILKCGLAGSEVTLRRCSSGAAAHTLQHTAGTGPVVRRAPCTRRKPCCLRQIGSAFEDLHRFDSGLCA